MAHDLLIMSVTVCRTSKKTQIATERTGVQIPFVRAMKEEGSMTVRLLGRVIMESKMRPNTILGKFPSYHSYALSLQLINAICRRFYAVKIYGG